MFHLNQNEARAAKFSCFSTENVKASSSKPRLANKIVKIPVRYRLAPNHSERNEGLVEVK